MRLSSVNPTYKGRTSILNGIPFYKVKTMLSLTSHFSKQGAQVLKEVNHVFFYPARNPEAIKVKEECKVVTLFLISFHIVAAN